MKEIEILFSLKGNIKSIEQKIESFTFEGGEKFLSKGEIRIVDTYYKSVKFKDLDPDDENRLRSSFRVREKGDKCLVAHKQDIFDGNDVWVYSNELETMVSDPAILKGILGELHFQEFIKIDNVKKIFESSNYELVIERVAGLGDFIEIEYKSKNEFSDDEVSNIKHSIRLLINNIGIDTEGELNSGKPELMLKKLMK